MSKLNPLAAAIGAAVVSSGLSLSALAANPFQATELSSGYQLADAGKTAEGKCGEGKCGEGMCGSDKDHSHDPAGKYGPGKGAEGKCGEGKCGEGMCGSMMQDQKATAESANDKTIEGKCGEGVCGGNMEKHQEATQAKP
jgi:uncharacterized low-complexity protein